MSTVAYGALQTLREKAPSGMSTSDQPPGLGTYIDVLTALVPAEVLAINAVVVTLATKTTPGGGTQPTDPSTLRLAFWLLTGLSVVLYILGRRPSPAAGAAAASDPTTAPNPSPPAGAAPSGQPIKTSWWSLQRWEPEDLLRAVIPPASFALWAMLDPASAWSSVVPGMSSSTRILIGMVGATALAAITKALATHADLKAPPGGGTSAQAGNGNADVGNQGNPGHGAENQSPGPGQPPASGPGGQPPVQQPPLVAAGSIPPVPDASSSAAPPAAISAGPPWVDSP
jgi:hypothetical protein